MRWSTLLVVCAIACQSGCQNFGGGGYPMQSVTRVPPPGTGSYPMQGGYYNTPSSAQSAAPPGSLPATTTASNPGAVSTDTYVAQAQYTATDSSPNPQPSGPIGSTMHSVPVTDPVSALPQSSLNSTTTVQPSAFPQASGSPSLPTLQWQGNP